MKVDKRTLIVVGGSVAIGFVGDLIIYSLAESKGQKFKIHMPKGKQLFSLIALGIVTGLVLDFAVKKIEYAALSPEGKKLVDLVKKEEAKIASGELSGKTPRAVDWA